MSKRVLVRSAVGGLLLIHATLLAYSATRHSPTVLEPAFLAAGISHWQLGRFDLYRVNPPLQRLVAALPALAVGCQTDWRHASDLPGSRSEFAVGEDFLYANGDRSASLVCLGRWACIPFSLLGGYFAYRWANELYGGGAGLLSLVLWCFEPNLMAHAEFITSDSACTALGIAASYSFWNWLRRPGWGSAIPAGAFLGLAELSKMSWLILFGVWPALWATWRWSMPSSQRKPRVGQLAVLLIVAWALLNACYLFEGTFSKFKTHTFVSRLMTQQKSAEGAGKRLIKTCLGECRVPVPSQYLLGFDAQNKDFEDFQQPCYLRGEWKQGGWWYYYVYGLLVKVPSGTWMLFVAVTVLRVAGILPSRALLDELVLLAPAAVLLALASSQTSFDQHVRYVYPCIAPALVFLGQSTGLLKSGVRLLRGLAFVLVGYSVASCLSAYPHQLAYFNDFAGGPWCGQRHLLGSNIDWLQDGKLCGEDLADQARSSIVLFDPPVRLPKESGAAHSVMTVKTIDAMVSTRPVFGTAIGLIVSVTRLSQFVHDPEITNSRLRVRLANVLSQLHSPAALDQHGARRIGFSLVYIRLDAPGVAPASRSHRRLAKATAIAEDCHDLGEVRLAGE